MTKETKYGIRKATPSLPARDLLVVPSQKGDLEVGWPAFGPNTYDNNVAEMSGQYAHSVEIPVMTFRPATTAKSLLVAAYKFAELAKPQIFDPRWLQAGRIVRTSEGVFANPPINKNGKVITDESKLKKLLDGGRKIAAGKGNIYFMTAPEVEDFGFAPYETFERGVQEAGKFVEGGLARVLEHTEGEIARNFEVISSPQFYGLGVNVFGFEPVEEPVSRVVSLGSVRYSGGYWLGVFGDWVGYDGYAFGVLAEPASN